MASSPLELSLEDAMMFWALAAQSKKSIQPRNSLIHWKEQGLLKLTSQGDWTLDKSHHLYEKMWPACLKHVIELMITYREPCAHLYIGLDGDPSVWERQRLHILAIKDISSAKRVASPSLLEAISLLNSGLSYAPRHLNAPLIIFTPVAASTVSEIDFPWKTSQVLYGSTTWFTYRHTLTGLLIDARLARSYASEWTPVAVDIMLTSSAEHRIELRSLFKNDVLNIDVLEKTKKGLANFLTMLDEFSQTEEQWEHGLLEFVKAQRHTGARPSIQLPQVF